MTTGRAIESLVRAGILSSLVLGASNAVVMATGETVEQGAQNIIKDVPATAVRNLPRPMLQITNFIERIGQRMVIYFESSENGSMGGYKLDTLPLSLTTLASFHDIYIDPVQEKGPRVDLIIEKTNLQGDSADLKITSIIGKKGDQSGKSAFYFKHLDNLSLAHSIIFVWEDWEIKVNEFDGEKYISSPENT